MNIVMGAIALGDAFFLLIGDIAINKLGWGWKIFVIIISGLLLCSSLAFYFYLEEIPLEASQEDNLCEKIHEQIGQSREILSQPNKLLVILEFAIDSCLFYNMLTWYPYFFTLIGFPEYAPYLSIITPFCFFLAPLIIEPMFNCCQKQRQNIICILLLLNIGVFVWLMILGMDISDSTDINLLFGLVIVQAMLYSDPYCRTCMIEMAIEG